MRVPILLLLALLLSCAMEAEAGSKASKACNMCRKEKNVPETFFPSGYSGCSDYYGSPQCPVVNTDTGNTNPSGYAGPQPDCHTDPYTQNCPKKEQKFPTKYNSRVNSSGHMGGFLSIEIVFIILIFAVIFVIIVAIARSKASMYQMPQNIVINSTFNVGDEDDSADIEKPSAAYKWR